VKRANPAVALNFVAADEEATDDDLEQLQRALEKQRVLLEEKEAELAKLKAKWQETLSRKATAAEQSEDEMEQLKQRLKAMKKSEEWQKLKELEDKKAAGKSPKPGTAPSRDKDAERREALEKELAEFERIYKEQEADLAKLDKLKRLRDGSQATDKETYRDMVEQALAEYKKGLKGGAAELAKALAELEAARAAKADHERRAQDQQTAPKEMEALKRLEQQVQRWADGKRAIEPEEMKKALAELHGETGKKKYKISQDIQEQVLREKEAALAELKRALGELRGKSSPDGAPSKRENNARLEELQKLLKRQQEMLQQKEDEINKLQDLLKQFPKGKEKKKEKDEEESPDNE
jgi:hypothetical protein